MKELKDISQVLLNEYVKVETSKNVTVGLFYGYDTESIWLIIGNDRISIDWDLITTMDAWRPPAIREK